jgi:hypothetical protein
MQKYLYNQIKNEALEIKNNPLRDCLTTEPRISQQLAQFRDNFMMNLKGWERKLFIFMF